VQRAVSVRFGSSPSQSNALDDVLYILYQSLILAQNQVPQPKDPNAFLRMILPLVLMMVLFYFLLLRPQRRREQELRQMVQNVKENDRIVTVGGIYGVVTNVQRDTERVTVRVDETTGTKLKINMSSIARVITDDEKDSAGASGNKS
jgi:preprotein translocase subunit YajC